ncbi:GNAT family N-acetyltransferase [Eisenibacter elegans]|jgi:hypothetical protein|uniref:GNAT family N-acetyltransferase n=1 Tax=Eisenibacter elegans TaxID=997 RepID=UPI000479207D|nr:GNAT family N-acetyltransferase [Eisenibacter elegans]
MRTLWDTFVRNAYNGHFLFERAYVDYHADRFVDASWMFWQEERLVAVLPANQKNGILHAHSGLSFSTFICLKAPDPLFLKACWSALSTACLSLGLARCQYRPIPGYYNASPYAWGAETAALALVNATRNLVQTGAVVDLQNPRRMQQRRYRGWRKAQKAGLYTGRSFDFEGYWNEVLEPNLHQRYATHPTHSLLEISTLAANFEQHIRLYGTWTAKGRWLAGVVIYANADVAHTQYIASTPQGRELGALDLLLITLIRRYQDAGYRCLSLGTSNSPPLRQTLNQGLWEWKQSWGAVAYPHECYQIDFDL